MPGAPGARCSRLFLPRPLPVPVPCRSPFPVSPPPYPSRCQVLSGSPPLLLSPLFSSPPRPVPFRPSPGKAKAQRRAEAEPCRAGGARGPPWHQTSATSSDGACDDRAAKVRAGRGRRDGTVPVPVPVSVPAERGLARVAQLSPTGNGPGRVPPAMPGALPTSPVPSPHPRGSPQPLRGSALVLRPFPAEPAPSRTSPLHPPGIRPPPGTGTQPWRLAPTAGATPGFSPATSPEALPALCPLSWHRGSGHGGHTSPRTGPEQLHQPRHLRGAVPPGQAAPQGPREGGAELGPLGSASTAETGDGWGALACPHLKPGPGWGFWGSV